MLKVRSKQTPQYLSKTLPALAVRRGRKGDIKRVRKKSRGSDLQFASRGQSNVKISNISIDISIRRKKLRSGGRRLPPKRYGTSMGALSNVYLADQKNCRQGGGDGAERGVESTRQTIGDTSTAGLL